jgi:hypothetical protein
VKSSPVGSLAEWHSTQYVEKKPIPQLAQVSLEPSGADASGAPGARAALASKPAASTTDKPESFAPPAELADEHADATRADNARRENLIDPS